MADTRQTAGTAPALALGKAFAPVPTATWDALVRQDLKGADYHARLVWHTAEGIPVKPFYRSEDLSGLDAQLDAVPGVPRSSAATPRRFRRRIRRSGKRMRSGSTASTTMVRPGRSSWRSRSVRP